VENSISQLPLLLLLVVLGARVTYSDFKDRKIKNRDLLLGAAAGVLIYAFLLVSGRLEIGPLFAGNMALAVVLGLCLYFTDSWGAGDAKFFIVASFLVPSYRFFPILPFSSAVIFLTAFFLSSIYFVLRSAAGIAKNPRAFSETLHLKKLANRLILSFFVLLSLSWVLSVIFQHPALRVAPVWRFIFLYLSYTVLWKISDRFRKKIFFWASVVAGLTARFLIQPAQMSPEILSGVVLRITVYSLFFHLFNSIIFFDPDKETKRDELFFAPFIFCGAVLAYTDFFCIVLRGFQCLQTLR